MDSSPSARSHRAIPPASALRPLVRALLFSSVVLVIGGCSGSTLRGNWIYVGHPDDSDVATREPARGAAVKILTEDHFAFGTRSEVDGPLAGGGRWRWDDGSYVEIVEYHWIDAFVGATLRFECTIDGDLWIHRGSFQLAGRTYTIAEAWRRLETLEGEP